MLKERGKENKEMQHCSDERKGNTTLTGGLNEVSRPRVRAG